jgi:hypothetical protein
MKMAVLELRKRQTKRKTLIMSKLPSSLEYLEMCLDARSDKRKIKQLLQCVQLLFTSSLNNETHLLSSHTLSFVVNSCSTILNVSYMVFPELEKERQAISRRSRLQPVHYRKLRELRSQAPADYRASYPVQQQSSISCITTRG